MNKEAFELDLLNNLNQVTEKPMCILHRLSIQTLRKMAHYTRYDNDLKPLYWRKSPFKETILQELKFYEKHGKRIDQ